ncbi:MAG: hypothetical protein ACYDIE_12915 [Candidatus Krumholzibacteriia bacterium]
MSGAARDTFRGAALAACALLLCGVAMLVPPARAARGEADPAPAAAAPADSVPAAAAPGNSLSDLTVRAQGAPADSLAQAAPPPPARPFIVSWDWTPTAHLSSGVRTVRWEGGLGSDLVLRDLSVLNAKLGWSRENYRQQTKTVESRDGTLHFADASGPRFRKDLTLTRNWSEDRTVNTAGNANINRRDFRQALASLDSLILDTGAIRHSLRLAGRLDKQKQSSLGIPNDFSERNGNAGLRSRYWAAPGVVVVANAYGERAGGTRTLGRETSSSSSSGDTLGAFVGYTRRVLSGAVSARMVNYDRRYLDYRRNANGIIDTLGAVQKIVQELEQNDALAFEWRNTVTLGALSLDATVGRDLKKDSYAASGAGRREDHQDRFRVDAGWTAGTDTIGVAYNYMWVWDDQTYRNATAPRGRQISKNRELTTEWAHRLFTHSALRLRGQQILNQQIAQRQFNDNDRDRLENNWSASLVTDWSSVFRTTGTFAYRHVEDIAIRRNRSANNNFKDTYEMRAGYFWPLEPWLQLRQDYRLEIQFTDYLYDYLPTITLRDDYNKRGNLSSRVTLKPSPRLSFNLGQEYSVRSNAGKVSQDVAGNAAYARELEQRISTVSFGLIYQVQPQFTLEGATERTRDVKTTFGSRPSSLPRLGGQVWIGGTYSRTIGQPENGRSLTARVKKYYAYGPNVQAANADYWDADISLGWKF